MKPILFSILGLEIHTYTAANVLAYGLAIFIVFSWAKSNNRNMRDIMDFLVVVVISALLGSKLFHTLFEAAGHTLSDGRIATGLWDLLADDPLHWARFFTPGYVLWGGIWMGSLIGWIFIQRRQIPNGGQLADDVAPALALCTAIGRLGCFGAGCCHGNPTDLPWGVLYPEAPLKDLGFVHPVQLYDAFFGFAAFFLLLHCRRRVRFNGELFLGFLTVYSAWRLGSEFFRGDFGRGFWLLGLSTSQLISLFTFPLTAFLWHRGLKNLSPPKKLVPAEIEF